MENCQARKFFLASDENQDICRCFPPAPVETPEGTFAIFPPMLNEGWCGEHKTKDQEQ